MDSGRFDALARTLAGGGTRRRLLALLATLPLAHALRTVVGVDEAEAAHPVHRVQKRAAKRRQRARHRQDHRHQVRTRDNGQGSGGAALGAGKTCVPLDQVCSIFGDPCCSDMSCAATALVVITTCQQECDSTGDCQAAFGPDFSCVDDEVACPTLRQCCRPNECTGNADCAGGGLCCSIPTGPSRCCAKGQRCAAGGGCQNA